MEAQGRGEVMTPKQLVDWLAVGPRWCEKYLPQRRIPGAFKVGREWRFERAAIEKQRLATGQVLLPKKRK